MTTYIYVKEVKSQVEKNNRAVNTEKRLFCNLDTWGNRTGLRLLIGFQSAFFRSTIQKHQFNKCPKISILFSHLCESIEAVKGSPWPHNLRSHFFIERNTFISYTPFFHTSPDVIIGATCFDRNSLVPGR